MVERSLLLSGVSWDWCVEALQDLRDGIAVHDLCSDASNEERRALYQLSTIVTHVPDRLRLHCDDCYSGMVINTATLELVDLEAALPDPLTCRIDVEDASQDPATHHPTKEQAPAQRTPIRHHQAQPLTSSYESTLVFRSPATTPQEDACKTAAQDGAQRTAKRVAQRTARSPTATSHSIIRQAARESKRRKQSVTPSTVNETRQAHRQALASTNEVSYTPRNLAL
mmetsp:Transcript_71199/g.118331  ORF Transcript_71199/g.118331 Transcript_71199/m.118331 type:complete len:226 (+) Transcript_71199:11-688(+)|eukprot:CAMPEP_0119316372 /NCGR_PEP_ID=MMETSP1333-20130426/39442_1 /TAXON_ID=418940 /ORGANISM="Scyphosphaera apsteinii, Strain RCC1455" /LENGTH=225 /DNA_ID=CAMNT_0007321999 /DNA_START=11 /DNA_END=688 /DNA_ORIENTATION=-